MNPLHPNEPQLVFKADSGLWLPNREYLDLAENITGAHRQALADQARRQIGLLKKAA